MVDAPAYLSLSLAAYTMYGTHAQLDRSAYETQLRDRNALLEWCLQVTRNGHIDFANGYPLVRALSSTIPTLSCG